MLARCYRNSPSKDKLYELILEYLVAHPSCMAFEVAKKFNLSTRNAAKYLRRLYVRGEIERVYFNSMPRDYRAKGYRYTVKNNNDIIVSEAVVFEA
jgi:predicted transcriptional regulator